MEAFFAATFEAWKNCNRSGREAAYMGYSPIIGVDGETIIEVYEGDASLIHVVRNPFSCYAETKKRPVPLSLEHYITAWIICQHYALRFSRKYEENFFVIRYGDMIQDPERVLGGVVVKMGLEKSPALKSPSWNGEILEEVFPWGTIKIPTEEANIETARALTESELNEIHSQAAIYIETFDYQDIWERLINKVVS